MELWKSVVGYEGLYEVSNRGMIRSLDKELKHDSRGGISVRKGKILKPGLRDDYRSVVLTNSDGCSNSKKVARLVAEAFIPNPKKLPQVNHKDLDKQNDHVSNLEWMTNSQNHKHAVLNEVYAQKLTAEDILKIRKLIAKGKPKKHIGKMFGITGAMVCKINKRETWSHVK
jgi:NUMOD4 motif/HNH endonuclease